MKEIAVTALHALLFGLAFGLGALMRAADFGHALGERAVLLALVLGGGAAAGLFHARLIADTFRPRRRLVRAGALAALLLAILPLALGGAIALWSRAHFAPTHEPLWTREGVHQFVWTILAGLYTFWLGGPKFFSGLGLGAVILAILAYTFEPEWAARRRPRIKPERPA